MASATRIGSGPGRDPRPARRCRESEWPPRLVLHWSRNPMAVLGALVILAWVAVAGAAPLDRPVRPDRSRTSTIGSRRPSAEHWLGVDGLGRDVLSRVLYGGRVSLPVAAVVVVVASIFGTLYGALAGFVGEWFGRSDHAHRGHGARVPRADPGHGHRRRAGAEHRELDAGHADGLVAALRAPGPGPGAGAQGARLRPRGARARAVATGASCSATSCRTRPRPRSS